MAAMEPAGTMEILDTLYVDGDIWSKLRADGSVLGRRFRLACSRSDGARRLSEWDLYGPTLVLVFLAHARSFWLAYPSLLVGAAAIAYALHRVGGHPLMGVAIAFYCLTPLALTATLVCWAPWLWLRFVANALGCAASCRSAHHGFKDLVTPEQYRVIVWSLWGGYVYAAIVASV